MELNYINHEDFEIHPHFFEVYISKLGKLIDPPTDAINVVFVIDSYIKALNKTYRGKNMPTDVLSFNYESDEVPGLMGEIYISVDMAKKQAVEHGHNFEDELIKLIVHGVLHVHGYDHEKNNDYKVMYGLERKVLGKIAGKMVN